MSSLSTLKLNTAYEDLRNMVFDITHSFARTFNLDFNDLIGEAHVIYTKQYHRYDPKKGAKLSTWLYTKIWFGLMSFMRKELRHHNLKNTDDLEEMGCKPTLFISELRASLSDEANMIIQLLLDSPSDFKLLLALNRARNRQQILKGLHEYLLDLNWTEDDIEKHIAEIICVMDGREPLPKDAPERGSFWDESADRILAHVGISRSEVRALLTA